MCKLYKFYQYPRGVNKGGVLNTEICPTISTSSWEHNCLLIELDANNQQFLKEMKENKEILRIPQATAQGYVEVEPGSLFDGSYPNSKTRRGRVQDNGQSSPTLTANGEPPYYYEGTEEWKTIIGNKQMNPFRGDVDEISPCITSACGAGGGMTPMLTDAELETTKTKEFIEQVRGHQPMNYRIRKLTPREVFRLMGVSETDIDKIQAAGISNSQQYKMAGNSIVVDVLEHLLKNLFVDTHSNQIDNDRQMRLF